VAIADLDTLAFKAINGLGFAPLDGLFVLVSTPQFGLASAALLAAWFAWRKRWDAAWILLAGVLAVVLADSVGARLIKPLFGRTRPCFALPRESVRLLVTMWPTPSMPSLHAANNMAAALVAFLGERKTGWVVFPLALVVSLSRIGVGVHWPTDVLAGLVWGAVAALCAWLLAQLARRGWRRLRGERKAPPAESPSTAQRASPP
jgi:undecaprenyl-diphosphatase